MADDRSNEVVVDLQCDESLSSQPSYTTTRQENGLQVIPVQTQWDTSSSEEQSIASSLTKNKTTPTRAAKRVKSPEKSTSLSKTVAPKRSTSTKKDFTNTDLSSYINQLKTVRHPELPLGTRVWTRVFGSCDWPSILWSLDYCPRVSWQELIEGYSEGKVLILFYGERSIMWVKPTQLSPIYEKEETRSNNLVKWGEKNSKSGVALAALEELHHSFEDPEEELNRIHSAVGFDVYSNAAIRVGQCEACGEIGPQLFCEYCKKGWHTLCLDPPILKKQDLKEGSTWNCPACLNNNTVVVTQDEPQKIEITEATGLTPDWIIYAAAYDVFLLQKPTTQQPYIKDLLDPCTNDKNNPNIPAEKLYDKHDNGLKLSNSWAGYYIILNPDYKSQVQWRFVNRAVDEVENDRVPAVILVCRNSTDAAYYQRLRPYPRVLLKRQCVRFKNYEHTPIGFGIVVFCIAKKNWKDLYGRFFDAFCRFGEMNMPIDLQVLVDPEFVALLSRVQEQAAVSHRDHWVQCKDCKKWRMVSYETAQKFKNKDWHCSDLKPQCTDCTTIQRKVEILGVIYASRAENDFDPDVESGKTHSSKDQQDSGQTKHYTNSSLASSQEKEALSLESQKDTCSEQILDKDAMEICSSTPEQKQGEDLTCFARRVCCRSTLEKLVSLPPKNNTQKMRNLDLQSSENPALVSESVLSSLDLARQSRMAANRAFLKGLDKEPSAIHKGEIAALQATNGLIADAAAEIYKRAEITDLEFQIQKAKRRCEEIKRRRQTEEARLLKELENKVRAEEEARQAKEIAIDAVQQLEARLAQLRKTKSLA
eukprot:g2176.t1